MPSLITSWTNSKAIGFVRAHKNYWKGAALWVSVSLSVCLSAYYMNRHSNLLTIHPSTRCTVFITNLNHFGSLRNSISFFLFDVSSTHNTVCLTNSQGAQGCTCVCVWEREYSYCLSNYTKRHNFSCMKVRTACNSLTLIWMWAA